MPIAEYRYFTVEEQPLEAGRMTHKYHCIARSGCGILAVIKWHGSWRQFCFFPTEGSLWSTGCLEDVLSFMAELKAGREKARGA